MNVLDAAGLPAAPDGGAPLTIDVHLLEQVTYAAELGPVRMLDERLAIRCQDEALARFLAAFLAAFPRAADARTQLHLVEVGGSWVAYEDGARTVTSTTVAGLARSLVWQLNRLALHAPTADVFVHAAVASLDGRAVILPGRSGAGKTTLVAALALAGWTYLSDEVAALGPGGAEVRPYPRPLALEEGSWSLIPDLSERWPADVPAMVTDLRLLLPASLGTSRPPRPAVPVAVVFPEVVPGAVTRAEPLSRAETLERLLGFTFNLADIGREGFDRLAACVRGAGCHRLVLDGVEDAPAVVRAVLGDAVAMRQ